MLRRVEPELLDNLPALDPRAVASRRDLGRLNALIGSSKILSRTLCQAIDVERLRNLAELGAGDGQVMLRLVRELHLARPGTTCSGDASSPSEINRNAQTMTLRLDLLDRQTVASAETLEAFHREGSLAEYLQADVFEWLAQRVIREYDAILCNLFLHHFSDEQVRALLGGVSRRTSIFVALEPRRSIWALTCSRLVWALGCNAVTRHDAVASVHAGFSGQELSRFWPAGVDWACQERAIGPFSHLFIAQKLGRGAASHGPGSKFEVSAASLNTQP